MDRQVDYIYRDIYDITGQDSYIWCTVVVYTDGTEEIILDK